MDLELIFRMIIHVIGGLGIFLLGMKHMSEGMQAIAGNRLRTSIRAVTNNRFFATGIGILITAIVQSSSVTTVMVVGFVNSGIMTLMQGIGVIMGSNIGTTITGWILVLKIGKYGLLILGIAAFFYLFSKKEKWRYLAMTIMGIGMIFFGLELMKNGFKPIREIPEFGAWFAKFSADNYFGVLKCALVGCILTVIVQSSSATLGITMGLALTGVIGFRTAAALVLGENIGTTITAFLASLGTTTNAKRAAYFHAIFNILGVLWITALFPIYIVLVKKFLGIDPDMMVMQNGVETFPHITKGIATVHTGFNVMNTLLFLPFVGYIGRFLVKVIPEKTHKEAPHLTQLDAFLVETSVIGIEQSRVELLRMAEGTRKMMKYLRDVLSSKEPDDALVKKIFHREEVLDIMQKEMVIFLGHLLSGQIPHTYTEEGRLQIRMADEYESVSDYIVDILKLYMRMNNANVRLIKEEEEEILQLHDTVADYTELITTALIERNSEILSKAHTQGDAITHRLRDLRDKHLARISEAQMGPLATSSYTDMLNAYRRVKDHALNIAEALAGEK